MNKAVDDMLEQLMGKTQYQFDSFADSISWFQAVDKPELFVMEFEDSGTGA